MSLELGLVSFVLRFVYDELPDESAHLARDWHGVIRHMQSNAERHFTRWVDAVAFIEQFVSVSDDRVDAPGNRP